MLNWLLGNSPTKEKHLSEFDARIDIHTLRKRVKIVVIDDDENAFPTKKLQEDGFTIEHWKNVKALDRLERGDFDIIVLDIGGVAIKLSASDGLGVLEHLKKMNPYQVVVAFSGQTFDLGKSKFFKMADDTLAKPVDVLKCVQVLDDLILAKFNISNLWENIVAILRKEKVSQATINEIEQLLVQAIESKNISLLERAKSLVEKADVIIKVIEIGTKIYGFFGGGK